MSNQQFFVKLREILAFLYSDEADAHRIAQDADLDVGNIAFSSKAINNWNAILLQAQKEGKTANLMLTVRSIFERIREIAISCRNDSRN